MRLLLLLPLVLACGDRVVLVDPPVEFEPRPDAGEGGGDPRLELGIFSEQFFTPILDGGSLPIIAGFQGGDWVMPAIRAHVLTGAVVADATVTMVDDGEVVGVLEDAQDRLQPTPQGVSEIVGLPVPIRHAGARASDPIDDLYGRRATLVMTLKDAQDRSATSTLEVELVAD